MLQLSKTSSQEELKDYFAGVMTLARSSEQFPVNLDDVWPLVYERKDIAVRELKKSDMFFEGEDYISEKERKEVFHQNVENPSEDIKDLGGRPTDTYYLSLSCLEWFIARKVRSVFEVYRKVFHVATQQTEGLLLSAIAINEPILTKTTDVEYIAGYIAEAYRKSASGEQFPINLLSVYALRIATMDEAIKELRTPLYDYKEGEDYIVKKEEKAGYYLSINGFIKLMGGANAVVTRAYEVAVCKGWIDEVPKIMQIDRKVNKLKKSYKSKKINRFPGTKVEQISEIIDRLISLQQQVEYSEEFMPIHESLSSILELKKFLDNIQEEE